VSVVADVTLNELMRRGLTVSGDAVAVPAWIEVGAVKGKTCMDEDKGRGVDEEERK
jgi:hypothetical protein